MAASADLQLTVTYHADSTSYDYQIGLTDVKSGAVELMIDRQGIHTRGDAWTEAVPLLAALLKQLPNRCEPFEG